MPLINGNYYANPAYGEALERGLADDTSDTDTGYNPGDEGSDWANEAQPGSGDPQAPAQQPPAPRQQPQPAQPRPWLTPRQERVAGAQAYAEGTDATQAEHEAMISAMVNRANSGDRLRRDDHLYDFIVEIDHNSSPRIAGRGSAVFLHLARANFGPTAGCVSMTKSAMLRLLARLGPRTRIVIG